MPYQEEELIRQKKQYSRQAVELALEGRWQETISINKKILESFPNDVKAYNRLGRAYMELGEYTQARMAYGKALELDPYNSIAEKNLRRLDHLKNRGVVESGEQQKVEPQSFIEEIGKAGVVNLIQLAAGEVLAGVDAGDKLKLSVDGSDLKLEDSQGQYLGKVEPELSRRLIKLIEGGNSYNASVISAAEDRLVVIIREVYQHPSQLGRLSFPSRGYLSIRPYIREVGVEQELEYAEAGNDYRIEGEEEEEPELIKDEEESNEEDDEDLEV